MKELWQKLKEWWADLALREKRIVSVGGIVVGVAIIYLWIWSPLINKIADQRKQIQSDEKLLQWMQVADKEIQKLETQSKNKSTVMSPVALLSYVQAKVKDAELDSYLTQLKQITNETIAMHFQRVEFDRMIRLLTSITKGQNVSIIQLSVVAEKSPGMVNADVIIKIG